MPNASMSIQVLPFLESREEVYSVVDKIIEHIAATGLNYEVGAFETSVDGELDSLLEIIRQSQLIITACGAQGMTIIKLSYGEKGVSGIEDRTAKHRH